MLHLTKLLFNLKFKDKTFSSFWKVTLFENLGVWNFLKLLLIYVLVSLVGKNNKTKYFYIENLSYKWA